MGDWKRGRRKPNQVSYLEIARNVSKDTEFTILQVQKILKLCLAEYENQIRLGHNVSLNNLGYIRGRWRKPHRTRWGGMTSGYYALNFKFTSRIKRFMHDLDEEGDFDLPFVDEYQDGVVTENGILRKKREEEEFLKNF